MQNMFTLHRSGFGSLSGLGSPIVTIPHFYRPQRSCGQNYVFTRVCHSVNGGGGAGVCSRGGCLLPWGGGGGVCSGGVCSGGGLLRGGSAPGGYLLPRGCLLWGVYPSMHWGRHPPGSRALHTVNERPVRILLECILVGTDIHIRQAIIHSFFTRLHCVMYCTVLMLLLIL